MPARAKRPCRHKGCAAITNDVSGYCDQHRQQHAGDGWRSYQSGKSRQERGYGRLWEIKRARILQRDKYLCQNHRRQRIAKKAASVDHIIPKAHGGTDDDSNLESLCWECHRAKTAKSVSDELYLLHVLRFTASYIRELSQNMGWFIPPRQPALQLLWAVRA